MKINYKGIHCSFVTKQQQIINQQKQKLDVDVPQRKILTSNTCM